MRKKLQTASLATAAMLLSGAAVAGDKRQLSSHEHGITILNVALENDSLMLELEGPAMNFVGFEYEPRTEKQKTAVRETLAALNDPAQLFEVSGDASCTLAGAKAERVSEDNDHSGHGGHHDGHHDDHHDDSHGDEKIVHAEESAHSEFRAEYTYECANTDELDQLKVKLFDTFPLTTEIEASAVGPTMQTYRELTKDDSVLSLKL